MSSDQNNGYWEKLSKSKRNCLDKECCDLYYGYITGVLSGGYLNCFLGLINSTEQYGAFSSPKGSAWRYAQSVRPDLFGQMFQFKDLQSAKEFVDARRSKQFANRNPGRSGNPGAHLSNKKARKVPEGLRA